MKIIRFAALASAMALALASCSPSSKTVDQSKLLIGIPKECQGSPVSLSLRFSFSLLSAAALPAASSSSWLPPIVDRLYCSESVSSADLPALDGQDPGAVFYDLSFWADFSKARGASSFGLWLADSARHSLTVSTSALGGLIVSSEVSIAKAGVWFVSVAKEDGAAPYGFDPSSDSTYQPCYVYGGGL